jgi:hypothetical protein
VNDDGNIASFRVREVRIKVVVGDFHGGFGSWPNIADHSQIVRFVSSFIADGFVGISRGWDFMGSF